MSETNEDLLTYELGNDDPVILNEDELLLSDDEGGIKLDQQDEEYLLSETEEWVSKQLAAKEGEQAAAGSREVVRKDARETDEPAAHRHRVRTPVQSVVKQQLDEPVVKNSAVADSESQAPVVVRQNAVPSVERSKPHAKDNVASEVEQSSPAVAVERQDASCVEPSVPTTTEDEVASESTVVHSHEVESAPDLKDVQFTPSRSSQDDGTVASSIYASPERSKAASVSTSPMTSSGGTRNSDRITTASQQCDTTSTEDLLETYTSNQEHDPSYDTDESSEKRGWKNETKSELRHPMQSQSHGQQQLHHGPPGGGMNRGPGQFGKPGMKHPLLPTQQQQAPHSGMGAPSLLGLQGPGFGGPMQHPGARMDFRQGAHRPRFPVRPNFPTDMNPFRGMPGRMNFQQHPGPGMHPGVVGPPGGGHMPQGMGMMGPHRGFPPRGHPRYDMVRPMRPGDHHGFDAGGMRGRPLGAGGGANGPQMFRSNGPPNGPAGGGGGAGGPVQGAPGIPVGPSGPYGPGGGPGAPQSVAPIGAAAANAGGPPQSLLSGSFDPMTVGGGSSAGSATNNPILPTPPTVPAFPQKVLINPNFKGGVEAVKNQLMRDAALNSQQFVAGVGAPRVFSDDELLRQQEEFINKNRIEVEKRRHERSPSRERDRERDRDRERERERERDRDRARSRERERSRERDRELRERERERDREPRARSRERSRERERERELRPRSRDREREYSPRRHRERAGSRDRDLGRPRRNFPRSRNASRDRDDDGRFPKRRKSGDYGENNRGNHERHDDDEDPETRAYRIEIEKQKATREKMLREKEMRRKRAAEEKLKNKANESKPQENTPPKLTPLVVTEKKIITLKKKSESASDEPRRPADDSRSNSAATVKPTDDHRARSRPESDQSHSNDGWLASRQRKISEPISEAIELDLLEELLLREPTPEPMPSRPVLSARESASGGAQVTTTSAPAAVVPATSSSLGGRSGSSSNTRDRNNSASGGGSSRRIVLKPMAEKKERENAASEAHHHHHHHHQQQQQHQHHPQGTPSKKSRIFDRLDKRIGVNEADKRKIQRLVKDN